MFTRLSSKFYYWHLFMGLLALNFLLFMFGTYQQYYYISQESIPAEAAKVLNQADWSAMRSSTLQYFYVMFWDQFIIYSFAAVVIGFNLLPRAWERFTVGCDTCYDRPESKVAIYTKSYYFYLLYTLVMCIFLAPIVNIWRKISMTRVLMSAAGNVIAMAIGMGIIMLLLALFIRFKRVFVPIISVLVGLSPYALFSFATDYIFNHSRQLQEDAHGALAFQILRRLSFPLQRVRFIPEEVNAFTTGFFNSAIIGIGGGLKNMLDSRELAAVVAHELGHWRYHHIPLRCFIISVLLILNIVLFFFVIDRPRFYAAFGFKNSKHVPICVGLILWELLMTEVLFLTKIAFNFLGMQCEYAADGHAVKYGFAKEIISSLLKMDRANPMFIARTWLWNLFVDPHPDIINRAAHVRSLMS